MEPLRHARDQALRLHRGREPAAGTAVGAFSTGADSSGTFPYRLVAGDGDSDNAAFAIDGQTLKTAATFDHETQTSFTIRVQASDGAGVTCEQAFTVTMTDVHDNATVALYDPATSTFYLTNTLTTGTAEQTFGYGVPQGPWLAIGMATARAAWASSPPTRRPST